MFLLIMVIPSVALASWWNPLSWFNNWKFSKTEKTTEILKIDKIQENNSLNKLNDLEIENLKNEIEMLKRQNNNPTQVREVIKNENIESSQKNVSVVDQPITLQILNVKSQGDKEKVIVTWDTTFPSESRLTMIDNDNKKEGVVFESDSGLGVKHSVKIINSQLSWKNYYKITATTEDKKGYDNFYSYFIQDFINYKFSFGEIDKDECQVIIVKDEKGNIIIGKEFEIKGINKQVINGKNYIAIHKLINIKTDLNGELRYCEKSNSYEITGVGVKEDSTITI